MITPMQMYLVTIAGSVKFLLVVASLMSLLSSVAIALASSDSARCNNEAESKFLLRVYACLLSVAAVSAVLAAFVPTTKGAAAVVMVPKIVNNEKIQNVGDGLYKLLVEWTEELRPVKKEAK